MQQAYAKTDYILNWEEDICAVSLEPWPQDPLGWRVAYRQEGSCVFYVVASVLVNRAEHLEKAGYFVPMTRKAIALLEAHLGNALPLKTAEGM